MPGWSTKSRPVRYAVRASVDPTDRSTLRVMMTTASPTASRIRIAGVSSRSRQPVELNRKLGVFRVAARITSSSTSAMAISRERTTLTTSRFNGDLLLGPAGAAVPPSRDVDPGRVEVSFIAVAPGLGWRLS